MVVKQHRKPARIVLSLFISIFLISSIINISLPILVSRSSADSKYSYDDILKKAQAWSIIHAFIYFSSVETYLDNSFSTSQAEDCKIFGGNGIITDDIDTIEVGRYVTRVYSGAYHGSGDGAIWYYLQNEDIGLSTAKNALKAVGINGCRGLLLAAGFKAPFDNNDSIDRSDLAGKIQTYLEDNGHGDEFFGAKIGSSSPGNGILYSILYDDTINACGWQYQKNPPQDVIDEADNNLSKNNYGDGDGSYFKAYTYEDGAAGYHYYKNTGDSNDKYIGPGQNLQGLVTEKPNSYNSYLDCGDTGDDGLKTYNANLLDKKFADAYAFIMNTSKPGGDDSTPDDPDYIDTKNCNMSGGLSWILCPVANFLGNVIDVMWSFIAGQLNVSPSFTNDPATKSAWNIFRDYANVAFIIAFLFIIYSQITSVGISNYGIKRMLPKLIIAAILVNASFYICQILVDVSNLMGYGIKNLFDTAKHTVLDANGGSDISSAGSLGTIITGVLISGVILIIALMFGLLLPILLAIALVFFILLLRRVLIIVFIIISPLAFVAYLLPNTEKWFKKWWSMFIQVLVVFPVIALVIGASSVAANIIGNVASPPQSIECSDPGNSDCAGGQSNVMQIVSVAVLTVPFFVIPSLLKKSLDAAGSIGSKIAGGGLSKVGSYGKSKANKSGAMQGLRDRKAQRDRLTGQKRADIMANGSKFNPRRIAYAGVGGLTKKGRDARRAQIAGAQGVASKAQEEAISNDMKTLAGKSVQELQADLTSGKGSAEHEAALIRRISEIGSDADVAAAFDHLHATAGTSKGSEVQKLAADAIGGRGLKGLGKSAISQLKNGTLQGDNYANRLVTRATDGSLSASDIASMSEDDFNTLESNVTNNGQRQAINSIYDKIKSTPELHSKMSGKQTDILDRITAPVQTPAAPSNPANQPSSGGQSTSNGSPGGSGGTPPSGGSPPSPPSPPPPPPPTTSAPGSSTQFTQSPSGLYVPHSSGNNPPPDEP